MWFVDAIMYFLNLFWLWIQMLFVMPFRTVDMLWILVPVWLSWFFAEFYQEKIGTSYGNAITNSVVVFWAGIDSIRKTIILYSSNIISSSEIFWRYGICGFMILYGVIIVVFGTRLKEHVKYFGRIRDVTYVFVVLIPITYHAIDPSLEYFIAAIIFFPLFYYAIEFIDRKVPHPKAVEKDIKEMADLQNTSSQLNNIQKIPPTLMQVNVKQQQAFQGPQTPPLSNQGQGSSTSYWSNDND